MGLPKLDAKLLAADQQDPGLGVKKFLDDVQGDSLFGFPKKAETFWIFQITDPNKFKSAMLGVLPRINTARTTWAEKQRIDAQKNQGVVKSSLINVAFSSTGMQALQIPISSFADSFVSGMMLQQKLFNDNWGSQIIKGLDDRTKIHGVFLLAGDSPQTCASMVADIKTKFSGAATEVVAEIGKSRPGGQASHEHFGFEDGVSVPAVKGVTVPFNGQRTMDLGALIFADNPDALLNNGSFFVFRHLSQDVPAFNNFVAAGASSIDDKKLDDFFKPRATDTAGILAQKTALFGARVVGRWASGAPLITSKGEALVDGGVPGLENDDTNNNFDFGDGCDPTGSTCPFQAHIRKTNPRNGVGADVLKPGLIMRRGIQFGPEMSEDPKADRGLLFACYQRDIDRGFATVQNLWANQVDFVPGKQPGLDILIGQPAATITVNNQVGTSGGSIASPKKLVTFRGGEYFFAPSITALGKFFSTGAPLTSQ